MGTPVAMWRQWLANLVVVGHRLAMAMLFFIPLVVILRLMAEEAPGMALLTFGLMAAGFVGTLRLGSQLLTVSPHPAHRGTARWRFFRLYRVLVGNGDAIQALARRINPGWQNRYTRRTPQQTAYQLASGEMGHWALVGASVAAVAAAIWSGHYVLGFVCVAANLLYNVAPNLVSRDTRQRLVRLSVRTAAGIKTDRSGGAEAVPEPEIPSVAGPNVGPGGEPGAAPDPARISAMRDL